jgi:spermidine synthase
MGCTLPLLTPAFSSNFDIASRFHAKLYAVNTIGAFVGCLIAGFYLLPEFGLYGTINLVYPANIIAGILLFAIASLMPDETIVSSSEAVEQSENSITLLQGTTTAFVTGFFGISLQIILMRLIGITIGSSEYAFSMCVAAFIFLLALGSWNVSRSSRTRSAWLNQLFVAIGMLLILATVEDWPYYAHVWRSVFTTVLPTFYLYHFAIFASLCAIALLAVGGIGSNMPLLFKEVYSPLEKIGDTVGSLYSWNTIGCALGALVGGYFSLFYLNLDQLLSLCIILSLASALIVFPWKQSGRIRLICMLGAVSSIALITCSFPNWNPDRLSSGLFREYRANKWTFSGPEKFYKNQVSKNKTILAEDGPNTSIRITERAAFPAETTALDGAEIVRNLYVNGKSDGQTSHGDLGTMRMCAHLPALLKLGSIKNVAVVGFGLGITAGSFSLYPEIENTTVIEISPALAKVAHLFDFANYGVTKNPQIKWEIGDAYRVLGGQDIKYSIIASEPSNPWVAGVERLYTTEFYELVKSRLEPSGLYAQWFHLYSISEETMGIVFKTFGEAFPHTKVFHLDADIIVLGSRRPIADSAVLNLKQRYESNEKVRKALAQVGFESVERLLATEFWLPTEYFFESQTHTLEFPKLSYAAGRDFFLNERVNTFHLLEGPMSKPWVRRGSAKALIGYWLSLQEDFSAPLRRFTAEACDFPGELSFLPKAWAQKGKVCRDALISSSVLGIIRPGENFDSTQIEFLKIFLESDSVPINEEFWDGFGKESKVEDVEGIIKIYDAYDSAMLPLSPEKLLRLSVNCREVSSKETANCTQKLILALANKGQGELAKSVFQELVKLSPEFITAKDREKLLLLVQNALLAEEKITKAN